MLEKTERIWFDGELIPWDEAKVHVLAHTLHYGVGIFEGLRCYKCNDGSTAVFRLQDHVDRLFDSARIVQMNIPFSREEVAGAIIHTLRANRIRAGYVRPLAFIGPGAIGVNPGDNPVHLAIAVMPWGTYLGEDALQKGVKVKTSSFTRHHVNVSMTKTKVSGNYVNSVLAKQEALADGYDEALMLDTNGYVAEATGENIFIIKKSVLKTSPPGSVLPGITRDSIITLARDMGYEVLEQQFPRDEIYVAEEAFFTGTAAELTPVRELDGRTIGPGEAGPVTKLLQQEFFRILHGENLKYTEWLTHYEL
jgi:branched-chain amino acid aminotransferase